MRRLASVVALSVLLGNSAAAQVQMRQTAPPLVTAENETWYLDGEPIIYSGQYYYPAGALVFFNGNEMVRSGFHNGVPLFTRTTLEPYSLVYVPVGRGLMQPYERPRSGDLAGTVGSRTPSFPVAVGTAETGGSLQAAAPPMLVAPGIYAVESPATFVSLRGDVETADPAPAGTTGSVRSRSYQPMHVRLGDQPTGLNAIFITYEGNRWYSLGSSVEVDPEKMRRVADYHGFPVWRGDDGERIYVATSRTGSLAVPYSQQKPALEIR